MKRFLFSIFFLLSLLAACFYLPRIIPESALTGNIEAQEPLKEALYYQKLGNLAVQCQLCPRRCVINPGGRGFCRIRENRDGILYSLSYAKPVSLNDLDPIEKKPLFHFLPATKTFSVATAGCNLRCKFCQNWEISQKSTEEVTYLYLTPEELVKKVKLSALPTIAYTYTEPTIFYEYMLQTAKLAKKEGIKNIMHSNGYINKEPLKELAKYLDAANIDLKGFSDDYYAKLTGGSLEPVLEALKTLKKEGVHLEITNLLLSGYNDNDDLIIKMCLWIKENLGSDTPLHFSRSFPMYKLLSLNPTPITTLEKARKICLDCGLKFVYIGNVGNHPAENTYCPKCKKVLIERRGYFVVANGIKKGRCRFCGEKIEGVF